MRKVHWTKRFLKKFKITTLADCWIWSAARRPTGYGNFFVDGVCIGAHRASWLFFRGPIPSGLNVCHRCDNPPCVNPLHLFLGTQKDNIYDMHIKGRGMKILNASHASDENHQVSKLTNEEVKFIRNSELNTYELERLLNFKVKRLAIVRAKSYQTYRDVR